MLYAARHNRVKITPPPKATLEEKLAFALLHHHALAPLWRCELGKETFERLQRLFPKTWVIDPRPMPPQGTIAGSGSRRCTDLGLSPTHRASEERTRVRRQAIGISRSSLGVREASRSATI